ncbi:MAG: translesion error-prone DNA polymerase V autoproteolytic subunit [Bacteroidales bacterium]|nr:translesion error-prone DNA polymerase V autoproteolytic subunit [Bacteroidales bacterium]
MNDIEIYAPDQENPLQLPLAEEGIAAGFPSPAESYMELSIDLNRELIAHPSSTFYGRVKGYSMKDAGIEEGDLLVIDKSLPPQDGDLAVCFVDGEFTLKHIRTEEGCIWLIPANEAFPPIKVTEENHFMIWGIVTYTIKSHRNRRHRFTEGKREILKSKGEKP